MRVSQVFQGRTRLGGGRGGAGGREVSDVPVWYFLKSFSLKYSICPAAGFEAARPELYQELTESFIV